MMGEHCKYIRFSCEDHVGVITLHRPEKLNALSWELAEEVCRVLRHLRTDDEVRSIVLTGAGRAFCAGVDVDWLNGEGDHAPIQSMAEASAPMPRWQRKSPGGPFFDVTRELVAVDKPVIAAVQGHAVGAGLAYALACDRRFGDATTKMGAVFTSIGVTPDSGLSYFLPRIVGLPNALMMVETGRIFRAEECLQMGLIDEMVPTGECLRSALEYAKMLAGRASVAVDMARRMVRMGQDSTLEEVLNYEELAGAQVACSADTQEGVRAFIAGRKPDFRGV